MQIEDGALHGVKIITPKRFYDGRGYFSEVWNRETLAKLGITVDFVQDNHSLSGPEGTIRGLHFQAPPHAQAKLVRCGAGVIWDVIVDIRLGSPSYGQWMQVELSAENGRQVFIPKGFLHGFITRSPNSELLYKCSDVYAPECDGAVAFDDPDLGIDWGLDPAQAVLSEKDRRAQSFASFRSPFVFEG